MWFQHCQNEQLSCPFMPCSILHITCDKCWCAACDLHTDLPGSCACVCWKLWHSKEIATTWIMPFNIFIVVVVIITVDVIIIITVIISIIFEQCYFGQVWNSSTALSLNNVTLARYEMITKKPMGVIGARQDSPKGQIEWLYELPDTCQLSG